MSNDDFILIKKLAKGSFGQVYLVKCKQTGQNLAIKRLKRSDIAINRLRENIYTEKEILACSSNPFIVKLKYAYTTSSKVNLVMEYIPGGQLFEYLSKQKRFEENLAKFYAIEVILALEYLHTSLGIIYRDLKLENILIDEYGHIKLTDFGLSKKLHNSQTQAKTFCGTHEYIAPEIIKGCTQGYEVDWWALGCLIYEMVLGKPPFYSNNLTTLYKMIINNRPNLPLWLSPECQNLLEQLLVQDPDKRLGKLGVNQIKSHQFFRGINWEDAYNKKLVPPYIPNLKTKILADNDFNLQTYEMDSFQDEQQILNSSDLDFEGFSFKYDENNCMSNQNILNDDDKNQLV